MGTTRHHPVHARATAGSRRRETTSPDLAAVLDEGGTASGKWSKRSVQDRVSDWIQRLNVLYEKLDLWIANYPDAKVRKGSLTQLIENLMTEHSVAPRQVPTYTILRGKKRIAFVPSAIWLIGANGRVNVSTNTKQHMLVDLGGCEGKASNWQLVDTSTRTMLRAFNRAAFVDLLEE